MCTRTVPVNGTNVLRVVDYVGEPGQFWLLGRAIDGLLHGAEAEYAECYCAGVAPEVKVYKKNLLQKLKDKIFIRLILPLPGKVSLLGSMADKPAVFSPLAGHRLCAGLRLERFTAPL